MALVWSAILRARPTPRVGADGQRRLVSSPGAGSATSTRTRRRWRISAADLNVDATSPKSPLMADREARRYHRSHAADDARQVANRPIVLENEGLLRARAGRRLGGRLRRSGRRARGDDVVSLGTARAPCRGRSRHRRLRIPVGIVAVDFKRLERDDKRTVPGPARAGRALRGLASAVRAVRHR